MFGGGSHPFEVKDEVLEPFAARIFKQHIHETDDPGNWRREFLPDKGGNGLVDAAGRRGFTHGAAFASAGHTGAPDQGFDLSYKPR